MDEAERLQVRVDSLLRWGIVFSLVWLAGLGSLIAFVLGMRARTLIRRWGGGLIGSRRAWWCLIVGAVGMLIWFPIWIIGTINQAATR